MKLLKLLLATYIYNLLTLWTGDYFFKFKGAIFLVVTISPFAYIMQNLSKWYFDNQTFILFVFGAIAFDHGIGSIYHAFWKSDFTWKKNIIGLALKVSLTVMVGFCFEGVNHIVKESNWAVTYLELVGRLTIFLWPAGSLFMNCAKITNGVFPPVGIIKWLKNFNKNLEIPKKE